MPEDLTRIEALLDAAHAKLDILLSGVAVLGSRVVGPHRAIGQIGSAGASQGEAIVGLRESRAAAQGGLRASGWLLTGVSGAAGLIGAGVAWLVAQAGP